MSGNVKTYRLVIEKRSRACKLLFCIGISAATGEKPGAAFIGTHEGIRTSDLPLRRKRVIKKRRKDGRFQATIFVITHFITQFAEASLFIEASADGFHKVGSINFLSFAVNKMMD